MTTNFDTNPMRGCEKLTFQPYDWLRLRRLWRAHFTQCQQISTAYHAAADAYVRSGGVTPCPRQPVYPPFPDVLRDLMCGAKNRRGEPCKRKDLMTNGRCRLHGGMSTGPKSDAGKLKAGANLALRWRSPIAKPAA